MPMPDTLERTGYEPLRITAFTDTHRRVAHIHASAERTHYEFVVVDLLMNHDRYLITCLSPVQGAYRLPTLRGWHESYLRNVTNGEVFTACALQPILDQLADLWGAA